MHINWQKTIIISLDVALATYLGFAFTKFNKPDEKNLVCTRSEEHTSELQSQR